MPDFDLSILNDGSPTHYHLQTGSYTCIDLSLCSSQLAPDLTWSVMEPPPETYFESDHFPIKITLKESSPPFDDGVRRSFKKANWETYHHSTQTSTDCSSFSEPGEALNFFYNLTQKAADMSIPKISSSRPHQGFPWWNAQCDLAVRNAKSASRRFFRSRTPINKIIYKRLRAIKRKVIKNSKRESWQNYTSTLNSSSSMKAIWTKVKKIQGSYIRPALPVLKVRDQLVATPLEAANCLAESFAHLTSGSSYSNNFKAHKASSEKSKIKFEPSLEEAYNILFSPAELKSALKDSRDGTPGSDNIHYKMIHHLHKSAWLYLLDIFNLFWRTGYFPDKWREAIIIPIPKPNKDPSNPINYRPISLTSCLCKLMEKMVCRRLMWYIAHHNILDPFQFGFQKYRSTADPIMILDHDIAEAFSHKKILLAVKFDLEKAYDTTWRYGIIKTLKNIGLKGSLPLFISNLLRERKFRVKVGSSLSSNFVQQEGVPQGSVLSVVCFALAINDLADVLSPDVRHLLYVDDLMIYTTASSSAVASRRIQLAINKICSWAELRGYKFSEAKTKSLLFSRRRHTPDAIPLHMYGTFIERRSTFVFLGVTFDERKNWRPHIKKCKEGCLKAANLLQCLSHFTWGADRKTLLHLYKALILPKLDYGAHIYSQASPNTLRPLQIIQNRCLRIILGAFKTSPTDSLHAECNLPPLKYHWELVRAKYCLRTCRLESSPAYKTLEQARITLSTWKFQTLVTETLERAQCDLQSVSSVKVLQEPPCCQYSFNICSKDVPSKKSNLPKQMQQLFIQHLEEHQNSIHIYTDGSKTNAQVGSAALVPSLTMSDSQKLPHQASIFSAELYAIILALKFIYFLPHSNFSIFSDSQSAIQAVAEFESSHPMVQEIQRMALEDLITEEGHNSTLLGPSTCQHIRK